MCNSFGISLSTQTPNCPRDRKTSGRVGLWNSHGLIHVQTKASVWLWVHVCRSALTNSHFSIYFWDSGGGGQAGKPGKEMADCTLAMCLPLFSHISTGQRALSRLSCSDGEGREGNYLSECMSHFASWSPWADLSVSVCPSASRAGPRRCAESPSLK